MLRVPVTLKINNKAFVLNTLFLLLTSHVAYYSPNSTEFEVNCILEKGLHEFYAALLKLFAEICRHLHKNYTIDAITGTLDFCYKLLALFSQR